ncbi:MAG: N-acetylmuramoyl-L-alanine amidase [Pseudohongiellaceae bacterium]|jgi:N-acetylmuramoyl-L-alanine amidase
MDLSLKDNMMLFKKPIDFRIKNYDHFIVHCTATSPEMDNINADWVDRVHKIKGWSGCGYHAVICRDGSLQTHDEGFSARPVDKIGAHVGGCGRGWNKRSFGVTLVGGVDANNKPENNFTPAQFDTLSDLIDDFKSSHPCPLNVEFMGHRDLIAQTNSASKACPCFDVADFIESRINAEEDEDLEEEYVASGVLSLPDSYVVKAGDSLWKIGQLFGVSVDHINRLNHLGSDIIHPGQHIKIPHALTGTHSVFH